MLRAYYATPLPAPETPIAEAPMVAMDMETTGLDPDQHAIVSIGLVPFTLDRIRLAERRHWVVHPPRALEDLSVTFHHITHSDIENAPDLGEILPELLATMAGRVPVVHYHRIERRFLNAAVVARLGEDLFFPLIDTMVLEAKRHRLSWRARLRQRLGHDPLSIRLGDSRERYHLPAYQAHSALVDAIATAELLQAQIRHRLGPETPLGELWC
ncbi:3'-5' exonuclease [Sediminicurvatus halobius]|uniref:3'-5' exonuclease n=1 Tax=Sediminicurvatus halobius TaxID=2182432 RepID=UPI001E3802F7